MPCDGECPKAWAATLEIELVELRDNFLGEPVPDYDRAALPGLMDAWWGLCCGWPGVEVVADIITGSKRAAFRGLGICRVGDGTGDWDEPCDDCRPLSDDSDRLAAPLA